MTTYTRAQEAEKTAIIQLANEVFKVDFPVLLPKLYGENNNTATEHYILKEEDVIKAAVGSFPLELRVGDNLLRGRGIGTVCVHPSAQGKGYMKVLMNNAIEDMKKEGIDFAILGGQRQRYEYFGFTPGGSKMVFTINLDNLRHTKKVAIECLKPLEALSNKELEILYHEFYITQEINGNRPLDRFLEICKTWENKAFAIYEKEVLLGYVITTKDMSSVQEIAIKEVSRIGDILQALLQMSKKQETQVVLPLYDKESTRELLDLCEHYQLGCSNNINIFNYKSIIESFLILKNKEETLEKGKLVIEIIDREKLVIEVGTEVSVTTIQTEEIPDITLTALEAVSFFTAPMSSGRLTLNAHHRLVQSWFPLPFLFQNTDAV